MRALTLLMLGACGGSIIRASGPEPLPPHSVTTLDTTPKERPRTLGQESFLRAYLTWFGGLAPDEVQRKARPKNLFDTWDDYLASLGMPEYRLDLPRATQSNALMVATLSKLGEALCVRAAEHDLAGKTALDRRVVFTFALQHAPSRKEFGERFDVLHRLFLSYPIALAPADRVDRYYALYRAVASRARPAQLDPDVRAWASVCIALIQHPEARLY